MQVYYKWQLGINGVFEDFVPVFKDDLAIDFERESGQQFFRRKLSSKITFTGYDSDRIMDAPFETEFIVRLLTSTDNINFVLYHTSHFYKTDCIINIDDRTVKVQPDIKDMYNEILDNLEEEYDLIKLGCPKTSIRYFERPMMQFYSEYETKATNINGSDFTKVDAESSNMTRASQCGFNIYKPEWELQLHFPDIPIVGLTKAFYGIGSDTERDTFYMNNGDGLFWIKVYVYPDGTVLGDYIIGVYNNPDFAEEHLVLQGYCWSDDANVDFEGFQGFPDLTASRRVHRFASRFVCDVPSLWFDGGVVINTQGFPANDFIGHSSNYNYCTPFTARQQNVIVQSNATQDEPTEWGQNTAGKYFVKPTFNEDNTEYYPIGQDSWYDVSYWVRYEFVLDAHYVLQRINDWMQTGIKSVSLRDAYSLGNVLRTMLAQLPTEQPITFEDNRDYSDFFYGTYVDKAGHLFMTPKSNIVTGEYQEAANKAPMTFKTLFTMLKNVYQCYWFIDNDYHFHIEHISWFKNGGSYSQQHIIGYDMTTMPVYKNLKSWAFDTSQYQFKKEDMPQQYKFAFMDDCSELFANSPLVIKSSVVKKDKKEEINISNFTTDLDYVVRFPSEISKDGYMLFSCNDEQSAFDERYIVPVSVEVINGKYYIFSNSRLSLWWMQREYWKYDLPAWNYEYFGIAAVASMIQNNKQQQLSFPVDTKYELEENERTTLRLMRTYLGDGFVDKMSINLCSRMAKITLNYKTYDNE